MKFKNSIFTFYFLLSYFLFLTGCGENSSTSSEPDNTIDELKDSSAFISKVFEFQYAPGQHALTTLLTTAENIIGKPSYLFTTSQSVSKSALSLGGWGGYVIVGFNHTVLNKAGNDIMILSGSSPCSEPGIIYVMEDTNDNNLPDDIWYRIPGSENNNSETYHDYQVTYYKPKTDSSNVCWKDNKNNSDSLISGYGATNTSTWWPDATKDSLIFKGTRLPTAYENTSTSSVQNWTIFPGLFTYGYAENGIGTDFNETYKGNEFDISNAVDANGNSVSLANIRFVKIQTGVFQQAGWLNEISTEIFGVADLNLLE